jgi:membrane-bound serine protease (ClpP class)
VLTIVALIVALIVLPAPWNWLLVIAAAVVDLLETAWMVAWSRRRAQRAEPVVGTDDLVGRTGVAASRIDPEGQVRVQGEIWKARSGAPVERGADVVVRSVDGLVLDVEPAARAATEGS